MHSSQLVRPWSSHSDAASNISWLRYLVSAASCPLLAATASAGALAEGLRVPTQALGVPPPCLASCMHTAHTTELTASLFSGRATPATMTFPSHPPTCACVPYALIGWAACPAPRPQALSRWTAQPTATGAHTDAALVHSRTDHPSVFGRPELPAQCAGW